MYRLYNCLKETQNADNITNISHLYGCFTDVGSTHAEIVIIMDLESLKTLLNRLETQRNYESEDEMIETYDFFIDKVLAEIEYAEECRSLTGGA